VGGVATPAIFEHAQQMRADLTERIHGGGIPHHLKASSCAQIEARDCAIQAQAKNCQSTKVAHGKWIYR
jgi:hypothetical protein